MFLDTKANGFYQISVGPLNYGHRYRKLANQQPFPKDNKHPVKTINVNNDQLGQLMLILTNGFGTVLHPLSPAVYSKIPIFDLMHFPLRRSLIKDCLKMEKNYRQIITRNTICRIINLPSRVASSHLFQYSWESLGSRFSDNLLCFSSARLMHLAWQCTMNKLKPKARY